MTVIDKYGRTFKTLRVSLINTCNLACLYCVEDDNENQQNRLNYIAKALPLEELVSLICKLNEKLNLKTIRLTGGEPLLYKDLIKLIEQIKEKTPAEKEIEHEPDRTQQIQSDAGSQASRALRRSA